MLWIQHFASPEGLDEAVFEVAHDGQDDVYVAGRACNGSTDAQMMAMKLDGTDGDVVWTDYHPGSAGMEDLAWDVVVGPDGHPVVTGHEIGTDGEAFCLTRKLDRADGDLIWSRRVPGALDNNAVRGSWLALLDDGDVVMCQRSWNSGYDTILQRYDAVDGSIVWETVYDGPTGGGDDPRAMIRDAAGDLLVAGVQDVAFNYDFMVLKFAAEDGSLIWEADGYDGPGGGWWDVASSIAEGPDGTLIVSGLSDGSSTGTGWDMATVAYDPVTGEEIWAHRLDGPLGTSDEARTVAVNALGDIYVTGYVYGIGTDKDLATLRLDAADPSPVTELPVAATAVRAWPNPFNPRIHFAFEQPRAGQVRLGIHDLGGRRVALLVDERLASGSHRFSWDGRNDEGLAVASGVYLAVMESGQGRSSRKIVLAK